MSWADLHGEHWLTSVRTDVRHPFDADASGIAFELDDKTVLAFEDPSDGYRSSCSAPLIAKCSMHYLGVSPEYIRVPVLVRECERDEDGDKCEGIEMIDRRNGKTVLRVGTSNTDDYYPCFTTEWLPKNLYENSGAEG